MTLNFPRSTLTRALITTRRMPNTPAYRAVIGFGKLCMIDLRLNGCRRADPGGGQNLALEPGNSKDRHQSSSSIERGQLALSRRERGRSARIFPPGWPRAQ